MTRADDPILRSVDAIGGLIEFWGFKRNMGRIWMLLYLEPAPLSAKEIADRLTLSSGAVSMTLTELQKWGVVKKSWTPGERRDFYAPETSVWKMVSRVLRERELTHIRQTIETFERAIAELSARREDGDRLRFVLDRLSGLLGLARTGEQLLSAILAGGAVDTEPIKRFFPG